MKKGIKYIDTLSPLKAKEFQRKINSLSILNEKSNDMNQNYYQLFADSISPLTTTKQLLNLADSLVALMTRAELESALITAEELRLSNKEFKLQAWILALKKRRLKSTFNNPDLGLPFDS